MSRLPYIYPTPYDDVPDDVRAEAAAERARRIRLHHWCTDCLGHTGPGSPCYIDEPEPEPVAEDDGDDAGSAA